jgi:hypothetical protein
VRALLRLFLRLIGLEIAQAVSAAVERRERDHEFDEAIRRLSREEAFRLRTQREQNKWGPS